jgi:S-(hydroxymethyl)glutathione dehydrogenase/alcohol dehydrogenase
LLVRFYQDGRLQLDEMVSQRYPLGDIRQALDDMHAGKLNRGVLDVTLT